MAMVVGTTAIPFARRRGRVLLRESGTANAAALPAPTSLLRLKNIIFNLNFYLVGHTISQHMGRHRIILGFSTQKNKWTTIL